MTSRSQSSIAASADGMHWLLLNASPDLREQLMRSPPLSPKAGAENGDRRHTPIGAVLVTNGDVDHVAGLLTLREKQALTLYGTSKVLDVITANPIFSVLDPAHVTTSRIGFGEICEPVPGLEVEVFPVPGKVPLYLENGEVDIGEEGEMTVGVRLTANGRTAFYIPGCAHVTDALRERVRGADALLFDGTVFVDDEMRAAGVGEKTGRRMGHVPISGDGGSLHAFDGLDIANRAYIHINNTNPILVEGSAERHVVEATGWSVAKDGSEIAP